MKKIVAIFLLLLCATTLQAKDKLNPADFTIKVHISATHMQLNTPLGDVLYADAILNGKKVELAGTAVLIKNGYALIIPGDYTARLTKDNRNENGTLIRREYEVFLSDGTSWGCVISGISE
jgi:hypothetical protein